MDKSRGGRGLEVVLPGNGLSKERVCLGAAAGEEAGGNYAIEHPSFLKAWNQLQNKSFQKTLYTQSIFIIEGAILITQWRENK